MSDDGSYHVFYTSNNKILVFTHSGGSLTLSQQYTTGEIAVHTLNSSTRMTRGPKGSRLVVSASPGQRFGKLNFNTGTNRYTE